MTTAEALLHRMLAAASTGNITRSQRLAFDREAEQVGPNAMAEAVRRLVDEREARRIRSETMKLTHPSEQASSEVAP